MLTYPGAKFSTHQFGAVEKTRPTMAHSLPTDARPRRQGSCIEAGLCLSFWGQECGLWQMSELDDIVDAAMMFAPSTGPLVADIVRALTEEDIQRLTSAPNRASKTPALTKLRHVHHLLARLLAEGKRPVECSALTGYSQSRISILQNDPAFRELVEYYSQTVQAEFVDAQKRLATLGITAIEELQARFDERPETLSVPQTIAIAEMALDRSIAPPKGGKGFISPAAGGGGQPSIQITFVQPQEQSPILTIEGSRTEGPER